MIEEILSAFPLPFSHSIPPISHFDLLDRYRRPKSVAQIPVAMLALHISNSFHAGSTGCFSFDIDVDNTQVSSLTKRGLPLVKFMFTILLGQFFPEFFSVRGYYYCTSVSVCHYFP